MKTKQTGAGTGTTTTKTTPRSTIAAKTDHLGTGAGHQTAKQHVVQQVAIIA